MVAQRRLLGTLVQVLAAVRSEPASSCVLPAKDAGTVVLRATRYTGMEGTSNSVLFGVQRGNVQQRKVREWDLALLLNLRKQARMMRNAQYAQSVWSCQLILSHPASSVNIYFVELVSTRWLSVAVLLHMCVLCVVARFNQHKLCGLKAASFIDEQSCCKKAMLRQLFIASKSIYCSASAKLTVCMQ
jgi:hypothetical protein